LKSASLTKCPDCGQSRLNHRVCGNCGKYNGKKVIIFEVKAKKGEKIKKEDKKAQEK
jgi:hypothetical protein